MACTITGINQNSACVEADGGLVSFYVTGFENIDTLTAGAADNEISAAALIASPSPFQKFVADEAEFQAIEEFERVSSRLSNYIQTLNATFKSLSSATALAIQQLEECCEGLVVFAVHNQVRAAGTDPIIRVYGLQLTDTSGSFKQTKRPLRTGTGNIDSGTIDTESQNVLALVGTATKPAPYFTGTVADLDALVTP